MISEDKEEVDIEDYWKDEDKDTEEEEYIEEDDDDFYDDEPFD